MVVYRIAKETWAADLAGTGARLHGGRWNPKGTPVLYTAPSRALATVEYLVHVDPLLLPTGLRMVAIELPDASSVTRREVADLPEGWDDYPPPTALAKIGAAWIASAKSLVLEVPSAVVRGDFLCLINPLHPEARAVRAVENVPYAIDTRLLPAPPERPRARRQARPRG